MKALRVTILFVLLLAGCSTSTDEEHSAAASATSVATVAASEPTPGGDKAAKQAGRSPRLVTSLDPAAGPGEARWMLVDVVGARTLLVDVPLGGSVHGAALVDVATGRLVRIGPRTDGSIFAADADRRHVVWVTSDAPDLFTFPWELYGYDRVSHRVQLLAEAPDVGVTPVPAAPNGTAPSLHGGRAYFAAVRRVLSNGRPQPAIYSVPVTGGPMRLEVDHAYDVTATDQGLIFERSAFAFYDWKIQRQSYGGGTPQTLAAADGRHNRFSGRVATKNGDIMWQEYVERGTQALCSVKVLAHDEPKPALLVDQADCDTSFSYYPHASRGSFAFSYLDDDRGYLVQLYRTPGLEKLRFPFGPTLSSVVGHGMTLAWTGIHNGHADDVYVATLQGS